MDHSATNDDLNFESFILDPLPDIVIPSDGEQAHVPALPALDSPQLHHDAWTSIRDNATKAFVEPLFEKLSQLESRILELENEYVRTQAIYFVLISSPGDKDYVRLTRRVIATIVCCRRSYETCMITPPSVGSIVDSSRTYSKRPKLSRRHRHDQV